MIKQQWRKIGIDADVKEIERESRLHAGRNNTSTTSMLWSNSGSENHLPLPASRPAGGSGRETHLGMPFARWYASNGTQGKKPTIPEMLRHGAYRSAAGKKEAERIKIAQEIWKIIVRGVLGHRHGRPVARVHGRAGREEHHGEHPGTPDQRAARADPNTSHPATFFFKG